MKKLFPLALLCASAASPAFAAPWSRAADVDYLTPYVGSFDALKSGRTTQFGLEYRFREWDYGVRPTLGANVDTEGALYGYGGINWEIPIASTGFSIIPNFMAGLFSRGDGRRLGGPIEFRTGIEVDYQFANAHRVGLAFNHISNANIYERNPGAETLLINYSIPVSVFR